MASLRGKVLHTRNSSMQCVWLALLPLIAAQSELCPEVTTSKPCSSSQDFVFVVDASDRKRHKEAHGVLSTVLGSGELSGLPFLAFCNKMDLAEALPPAELARALDIINLSDRAWHLQPSCALSGEGVQDGISWLVARVKGR